MIRRTKRRFITAALSAVLLVLVIMIGAINLFSLRSVITSSDQILRMIEENDGALPEGRMDDITPPAAPEGEEGEMPPFPAGEKDSESFGGRRPGDEDKRFGAFRGRNSFWNMSVISEETPFESRYFTVRYSADGTLLDVSTDRIAAVDEEGAEAYAADVLAGRKTSGFADSYRFLKTTSAEGETRIIFLDCARSLAGFRSFLYASLLVSGAAFLIVAVLVILLAGRILRPVEESYVKQKTFITDAGHEMKTPVAVIEADASVLEMEIGENEWVADIRKQTERLASLTKELTYLARMDEGGSNRTMIEFPLSDVVSEMAQSFRARAIVMKKRFETEIAEGIGYTGDEAAIRKLLSILLDNALKYSNEEGEIRVRLARKNRNVELSVFNTAEEIDPASLPKLFERFYRADRSRNSESGGFGIGLSIAKAVAEAHKGRISASSADGRSVTFTVVLPV